ESLADHERPLKKRGKKDSKRIAKVMLHNDLMPDLILSSSAVRAKETVEIIVDTLDYTKKIVYLDELYMGEPLDFIKILEALSDDYNTVLIVGHNPGLEAYLQIIDGEIEALPTAGLGHLVLVIDHWNELSFDTMGDLVGFWTPKTLEEKKK
ncbi:MAG: SixA phosphatase family protein, partial [Anaerolineales bacterium]